jgi:hypothetical protein
MATESVGVFFMGASIAVKNTSGQNGRTQC